MSKATTTGQMANTEPSPPMSQTHTQPSQAPITPTEKPPVLTAETIKSWAKAPAVEAIRKHIELYIGGDKETSDEC